MLQLLYIPLYAFYIAAFLWLIFHAHFFNISGVKKTHLAFFFLLKVVAGLALTLVYTYYYTDQTKADVYRYFMDSKIISSLLFTHPAYWLKIVTGVGTYDADTFTYLHNTLYFSHPSNDFVTNNRLLIRIISLLNYFSFYSIYINTLLLNCITFTALTLLFKVFRQYFTEFPQILYWPFYLLPSLIFWSSGLLKEGLVFVGLAIYLNYALTYNGTTIWKRMVFMFLAVMLIALTKIYVAAVVILCSIFLLLPKFIKADKMRIALAVTGFVGIVFLLCLCFGNSLASGIMDKRNEFIQLAQAEHSNSILNIEPAGGSWGSILHLIPSALVNAILRPFLWDAGPNFQLFFALENFVFIALLVLLPVLYFKKPVSDKLMLCIFCFCFAVLNYLSIGVTVPVLGAIVHYRIIAMPFLLLSVLLMTNLNKLKLHLTRLFSLVGFKS